MRNLIFPLAAAALFAAGPLSAQAPSTVSSSALDAAVAGRPSTDRAAVRAALGTPAAGAVATRLGLSPTDVAQRIAALDDRSAAALNDRVLAGGSSSVVISTTAIIIILLLLILLTR